MTDQLAPNVLVVNPDGTISAALSGSLTLDADVWAGLQTEFSTAHSVNWMEGSELVGQVSAFYDDAVTGHGLAAGAISPDRSTGAQFLAWAENDSRGIQSTGVGANIFHGGVNVQGATFLAGDGSSSFLGQYPTLSPAKVQWGSARVNVPNTAALVNVPFTWPWSTAHLFFAAFVTAAPVGFDFQLIRGCWPNDNRSGEIFFDSSAAQTLSIQWLSIGY